MEDRIYNLLEITLILKSIRYKSHPIRAILLGILNLGRVQIKAIAFERTSMRFERRYAANPTHVLILDYLRARSDFCGQSVYNITFTGIDS